MTPFRERNPVVVGAVGLTLVVAALLGAFQLDRLAALTGRAYQAAFHDASGLATGSEVRVAGVRVGKVTAVELARDTAPYVRVRFRVDDDSVRLGTDTGATIRIKTVLGQKYLALSPAGPGRLREGSQIPLARTAAPFDVVQAVTGLADTLDKVDTDQLAAAFTTLSQTFAETPGSVNASLVGLSRLSRTVADRDAELRALLARARDVTAVLATRDEEFRKLVADGEALLGEVSKRRDAIHKLLVGTDDLATQLSGLVTDNRARLAPALRKLREVVAILQRNRDDLERTIQRMGPFVTAFANVVGNGRWFDSYVSGLLQPYVPTTGGR
ncbi:phospholipid/cholesterol/gamma-HCH transport system substrate-binding protein [Micromonospora palomenae]|uniref:Phospholipid/cholesterol/gamma-HCH transport system substrate-binding protein n=1 Tax=Micromonospora palomenae TaxID=1461247 RepID=A0A561WV05_9ACTN|nr:MCE family protein [Micromonospora palomenae]TWG27702.1 phospholipid/cholesterol/gamma-HCH transport system substrate-binding protein [Micromonospora palomenae]